MGEIVKPVMQWISANIPWTVLIVIGILSLFVEISKVKIFPLKWLWKLTSWPFRKIDEQRTESFKNLITNLNITIDNKLTNLAAESNANCAAVKACFVNLEKRLDDLDEQQKLTEERLDMLAAARIKNHVFNFARQIRKGEQHSHEDFVNLIKENAEYEALVEKYSCIDEAHKKAWENGVYTRDFAFIKKAYDEGKFIQ